MEQSLYGAHNYMLYLLCFLIILFPHAVTLLFYFIYSEKCDEINFYHPLPSSYFL